MARYTRLRRGLIKEHGLAFDRSRQFVATLAAHIAMCALQCERSPFVMVKQGRFPSRGLMTAGAVGDSGLRKLQAVDIRMTGLAFRRCRFEIHVHKPACWV